MGKIYYTILIPFFCLAINSCAEVESSYESENYLLKDQVGSSAYDILFGNRLFPSKDIFSTEQISNEKDEKSSSKKNKIFLVKQNLSGSREWIMDLDIPDEGSGISMTFDAFDNVYVTGYKMNGPEVNKHSQNFSVFLIKYNSSGSREWIKKLGKSNVEDGVRLIADFSDNIYATGFYNENGSGNNMLVKYDSSGNREWAKTLGSTFFDFVWDVIVDSENNVFLAGLSENIFAQNTNWWNDIFLIKFNTDGIEL
tara:strand:+ start:89 stop:850 length:762 start_codon:yes stop_codon:yes gene_type:complete